MKRISFIVLLISLFYYGCVDTVTSPTTSGSGNPTITVKYPLTNDTLQLGSNEFIFTAKDDVGVRAVELWIDTTYKALVNYDGTTATPSILWTADSTYLGKTIKYFLRVYNTGGKSTDSPTQTNIFVAKINSPPKAPTNLVLQKLTETIFNLSWKHDDQNVDSFRVYKKTGVTGIYRKQKTVAANIFNTNVDGIDPTSVCFFKVIAYNEKGESAPSNEVSTAGTGTGGTIAAPTNLSAVVYGSRRIVLTWKDNSDNENYFKIERKTFYTEYQSIGVVPENITTFNDSGYGLVPSTDYYYHIKAVSGNDSITSSEIKVTTGSSFLLVPATIKTIDHNSKNTRLTWMDNSNNKTNFSGEFADYVTSTNFVEKSITDAYVFKFNDEHSTKGKTYMHKICATDGIVFPVLSNVITIKNLSSK